jgi:hypothetical protein
MHQNDPGDNQVNSRPNQFFSLISKVYFEVSVCVVGIESDYFTFKHDLEDLFSKLKKFLNNYLCLFVDNRHRKTPNQQRQHP